MVTLVASAIAGSFNKGDTVTLSRDETLYFQDSAYRKAKRGESFTVFAYNALTLRVYVITKDSNGKDIALNIPEEAFSPQPSAAAIPKSETTGPKLDSFLDIPWGATQEDAAKIIEARPGLERTDTKERMIKFKGGQFGGRNVDVWVLGFLDNRFHTAKILFYPRESHIIKDYGDIKQLLFEKYGKPSINLHRFKYPYEAGDGHELTAIKLGKASICALWDFPVPGKKPNTISVEINETMAIELVYQNGELIDKVVKTNKEQNKKDL